MSLLRSIRHSLHVNGQPQLEELPFFGSESKGAWLWSKRTEQLTERGAEKARELYDLFANFEGAMGFFEFRGYLQAVGRPNELDEHVGGSQEAWRCYMFDSYGTDYRGSLTPEGFILYRESIEHRHPLEFDLLRCGITVLPKRLVEWRRHNAAFDKLARENVSKSELRALQMEGRPWIPKVPKEELQLLAFESSGEVIPESRIASEMKQHFLKNECMASVREYYNIRHRFAVHQTSNVDPNDLFCVYRDSIAGWWFSDRPRFQLRYFDRTLTGMRLWASRAIRNGSKLVSSVFDKLAQIVERGLISTASIARLKEQAGRYSVRGLVDLQGVVSMFGSTAPLSHFFVGAAVFRSCFW